MSMERIMPSLSHAENAYMHVVLQHVIQKAHPVV